jgi:hypothetical protein
LRIRNLYALCDLGRRIANFEKALQENVKVLDMVVEYFELDHVLQHIKADEILELPISKKHAVDLLDLLNEKVRDDREGFKLQEVFSPSDISDLRNTLTRLQHALSDELSDMPIYWCRQIRAYSTPTLIENAEKLFDQQVIKAIPEGALEDIKEAAKCLAFEIPTASGIHMMRAFEKVFRRYYKSITQDDPGRTDLRTLVQNLEKNPTADHKTLHIIDQVRNLHRNPLAHDAFLTIDEAIDLFDIAKSAITAMARKL